MAFLAKENLVAEFKKLSPKELLAIGKSPKAEQFRNLQTGELVSKRQYQKQRQIGQYAAPEKKNPKKQHTRKIKPTRTHERQGSKVSTYKLTEAKARQLIQENQGKLGTVAVPLKLQNKMGYAPTPTAGNQTTPHYSDTMKLSLENFDRVLSMLGDNRKLTAKFTVTIYE